MKRSMINLLALPILALMAVATAGADPHWVTSYDGPGAGEDTPSAITFDANGDCTIAGASIGSGQDFDYVTIKVDGSGNEVWVARYDGPASSDDFATDVVADGEGAVYVTGASAGADSADIATVKYDADGTEVWVARYNGPDDSWDEGTRIGLGESGSVYVTGASFDAGGESIIATVKYDADGMETWADRYRFGDGFTQEPRDLAAPAWGGVVIVGAVGAVADTSGDTYDYLVLCYASDGTLDWSATYDGPGGGMDAAEAVGVDEDGTIFVTGLSEGDGTGLDYATLAYSSDGTLLWEARRDGSAGSDDVAVGVAVDATGSVVVTGMTTETASQLDFTTVKYDVDGVEQWAQLYDGLGNGEDAPHFVATGGDGEVFVTGRSWAGEDESTTGFATVKYASDGTLDWVERYDVADSVWAEPVALGLDPLGNLTVTGTRYDIDTGLDLILLGYGGAPMDVAAEESSVPARLQLYQNSPNPFSTRTTIRFALPRPGPVSLRVYDPSGREVARLLDGMQEAGRHAIPWSPAGLAKGIYLIRLRANEGVESRKMMVLD
ncbi:MAG: T9SS type A sorting domain-containing protein [Candidatus Eisenbacteria bacterium]|nr:T9SS type A sorting domain-containing protein [Candidatus Latescibacterota bacterium]MBD3301063.1 T9SS type A sorting domain-containing protein [Candidatus Eisenbacteria bacterium]